MLCDDGVTYNFADLIERNALAELVLTDNGDNQDKIIKNRYALVEKVRLEGTTFHRDGRWNAVCLPFSLTRDELDASPLAGATFWRRSESGIAGSRLLVSFKKVTDDTFVAGEPYFVKWSGGADVVNPEFSNVVIQSTVPGGVADDFYRLCGTFDRQVFGDEEAGAGTFLTLSGEGALVSLPDHKADAFTHYLYVPNKDAADGTTAICCVRFSFEDDITAEKRITYGFEGNGTEASPYLIRNARQLNDMAMGLNAGDEGLKGRYFQQAANIAFDRALENNFTPVALFDAHYDGDGYVIRGLNINRSGTGAADDAAMFVRTADGSTLRNIIVANSSFTGRTAAALVCHSGAEAAIDNCHLLRDVSVRSNYYAAGGIVAYMNSGAPSVTGCSSQASVTANQSYAGGVVGMLLNGSMSACMYLGSSVEAHSGAGKSCLAGVSSGATVTDCCFTDPSFADPNAVLIPHVSADNSVLLHQLYARDRFLIEGHSGLTERDICYDLVVNGREFKALRNDDQTWSSRAYTLSVPFDMAIPEGQQQDVQVYRLHEIDLEKKEFIFTNEFPFLKGGVPYVLVIGRGSVVFSAANVLVQPVPMEPETVINVGGGQELGYWCSNFRRMENEDLVAENAYIMQSNGTYRHIDRIYASKPYLARFLGYFSALEPIGTSFKMKYVRTENGEETSERTDFPADLFYSETEDLPTDVPGVRAAKEAADAPVFYNLSGQRISQPTSGVYIVNGKKIVK